MTLFESSSRATAGDAPASRDFVFTFSYESFADARRRGMMRPPDRLVANLMSSARVRRLLVADPFRSWLTCVPRALFDLPYRARQTEKVRHVGPLRLARADPIAIDEIGATYLAYEKALRVASDRAHLDAPAFVTTNPLAAGFCALPWTSDALYYARDDWSSSPARLRYWPAYREAYARIRDSGRPVAAVSAEIIERIAPRGPHLVVPNGIEPAEWLAPQPDPPAWFARIPGPRATYVGTLDSRLDMEGIATLANSHPQLSIVLIGPAPDSTYIRDLRTLSNVHLHGEVRRDEVVAVLRNTEVTLLAHRKTPLTEAMSPLKVYEYLAAGRPVLATDLAPVRGLDDRVLLADSVADFVDLIDRALALGVADEDRRRRYVTDNAWSTRHEQILSLLRT
ncbi:glycosyltransferase [Microbacterium caowuchunii]|nr:glycosyltransferase [Microbacterium caowuchunii]